MKEQEYEELREQREKLKNYLKGPLTEVMRNNITNQLESIRQQLKGAHKDEYKIKAGISVRRV